MEENQSQKGGAKKFLTSNSFRIILIIVFESISIAIMTIMSNKYYNMFLEKNFWIYMGICVVLSIFTLSHMSGKVKKEVRGMNNKPNTIRILSRQRYHEEKREEAGAYLAFMFILSVVIVPLVAPVNVGKFVHSTICFFLKD